MRRSFSEVGLLVIFPVLTLASSVSANVNLQLQTVTSPVVIGSPVEVRLILAGTPAAQNVGFVQAVLQWDPDVLQLTGFTDAGAINWTSEEFYNDVTQDGLNDPFTGVPGNDGDAVFRARANTPVSIPTTGSRVTTFQFLAIGTAVNTQVTVPTILMNTATAVLNQDVPFGQNVPINTITNATVTVNCTMSSQCNDLNPCTDDACTGNQCEFTNDNGNDPNDGLRCNGVEQSCSNGSIIYVPGMGAVDCSGLNNACNLGVCNEPMGNCTSMAVNNGGACNDGMFCTLTDVCSAGTCVGSGIRCPGQLCNETTDACVNCLTDANCQDAQFCNTLEVCVGGNCQQGPPPCPPTAPICLEATDTCVQCISAADCDDGDFCTGVEACVGNMCVPGTAPCGGMTPVCCEATDSCVADCCENADCNDGFFCSTDVCDLGGNCVAFPNSALCSDGVFCNGAERCLEMPMGSGIYSCQPPSIPACELNDVCCEAIDGCNPDCCADADCSDNAFCNGQELCLGGVCFSGPAIDCTSLDSTCSLGVCSEMTDMCVIAPINPGAQCNDENSCTHSDTCVNGVCDGCMQGDVGCTPPGLVNIFWDPPVQVGQAGTQVTLKIVVRSQTTAPQVVDAIEAIVAWDPTKLVLVTSTGGNPNPQDPCTPGIPMCPTNTYDWLSSSFPNDCSLDGLNSPCMGPTPANDGNLFYTALAQLSPNPPAMAPSSASAGMHVTTLKFNVLSVPATATQVSLLSCTMPSASQVTRIAGGGAPGTIVTGTIGSPATINIQQCSTNAQCNDGLDCNGVETCVMNSCVMGTPLCSAPTPVCIEATNTCVVCTTNAHCSDGDFCTGTETCVANNCMPGTNPCNTPSAPFCDEGQNECVQCLSVADCNDGIPCTDDQCILGDCFHVPQNAPCQDGVFCNGAEVCTAGVGCTSPGNPCHDPLSCNEALDTCGNCNAPEAFAIGSRYISVTPPPGAATVALLITGTPGDPDNSCLSKYVQANGTLDTNPVFQTPAQWDTIVVTDEELRPRETYRVCTACQSGFSAIAPVTLWRYCDGNNDGVVGLDDILCVLNGFSGIFGTPPNFCTIHSTDVIGPGCVPNRLITLDDILAVLNAFSGAQVVPPLLCNTVCP